ncbi:MAG: TonB-dependent receptor [Nannocystis sp.]|nr:TonB-dependent receptor [Nannocystis sp.]
MPALRGAIRTLVYGALEADEGPALAERTRWTLSYQHQHERRHLDRPTTSTRGDGRDDVYSVGTGLTVHTRRAAPTPALEVGASYGLDAYLDTIRSRAWNIYTDVGVVSPLSRGQYLDGARYLTSGLWSEGKMTILRRLELRGGGRLSYAAARASGDQASASAAVDRQWVAPVGSAGASLRASEWLRLLVGVDQGFRAPNLDDLTSRQQTGPGFQLENAALQPERATSLEAGFKVESARVELAFFAFESRISGLVARAPRAVSACPGQTDGCGASQTVFQLVNLEGQAVIRGFDGVVRLFLPAGFGARATVSYAWGEGPNPVGSGARLPLSRIPPLNGVGELTWRSRRLGVFSGAALRWAAKQDRLALADLDDPRIPAGGRRASRWWTCAQATAGGRTRCSAWSLRTSGTPPIATTGRR